MNLGLLLYLKRTWISKRKVKWGKKKKNHLKKRLLIANGSKDKMCLCLIKFQKSSRIFLS